MNIIVYPTACDMIFARRQILTLYEDESMNNTKQCLGLLWCLSSTGKKVLAFQMYVFYQFRFSFRKHFLIWRLLYFDSNFIDMRAQS